MVPSRLPIWHRLSIRVLGPRCKASRADDPRGEGGGSDSPVRKDQRARAIAARDRAFLVRYADDVTAVFSQEEDARRVWAVLPKRFTRYGLTLHPEKTRLIAFRRPSGTDRDVTATPTSFDMLGFTHFWTRSLRGSWVIKRKTARDRFSRALRAIARWCRQHRHAPVSWQHAVLSRKLRGHYSYYGITGNSAAITRFRHAVRKRW